jgi:hypothetical protein
VRGPRKKCPNAELGGAGGRRRASAYVRDLHGRSERVALERVTLQRVALEGMSPQRVSLEGVSLERMSLAERMSAHVISLPDVS